MTKLELYCNFIDARRKAAELELMSRQLKKLASSNLKGDIKNIDRNWDGECSRIVVNKGNELINKMNNEANSLHNIAIVIRQIATNIYRSEMKALEIAKTRNNN